MCQGEKYCPRCKTTKSTAEFSRNKAREGRHGGFASYCKICVREYGKERQYDKKRWETNRERELQRHRDYMQIDREKKLDMYRRMSQDYRKAHPDRVNATNRARGKWNFVPAWADRAAMRTVYAKAREWSDVLGIEMHVDHIVPIRGKIVCGLHCEANLQLLSKELNHEKRHFVWPDMPQECC